MWNSAERQVEELTAFFRAQYDAVKSRITCQKWQNIAEVPLQRLCPVDGVPFHLMRRVPILATSRVVPSGTNGEQFVAHGESESSVNS